MRIACEPDPVPLTTGTHILAQGIIARAHHGIGSHRRSVLTARWAPRHDRSVSRLNLDLND